MINTFKACIFSVLFLAFTVGGEVWAQTDCDAQLAKSSNDYTQAIQELAQGYIGLEKMKIDDAPRASVNKISRELSKKKKDLISIVGIDQFNASFDKNVKDLSNASAVGQVEKQKRRKKSLKTEGDGFQLWEFDKELKGHDYRVYSIAFSPDSRYVVTGSEDATARIWDTQTGAELHKLEKHRRAIYAIAISPDSRRVVTASSDKMAYVWDIETGEIIHELGHISDAFSASFSADGRFITTSSYSSVAHIWDAQTGDEIIRFGKDAYGLRTAAFSPDGRYVVTSHEISPHRPSWDNDPHARIWDARTGLELRLLFGHTKDIKSASFSPDGRYIVTSSDDKTARIWSVETGKEIVRLEDHTEHLNSASFSPDGRHVITTSQDNTVRIWSTQTGEQVQQFDQPAENALYSPDGRYIVIATENEAHILKLQVIEDLE